MLAHRGSSDCSGSVCNTVGSLSHSTKCLEAPFDTDWCYINKIRLDWIAPGHLGRMNI